MYLYSNARDSVDESVHMYHMSFFCGKRHYLSMMCSGMQRPFAAPMTPVRFDVSRKRRKKYMRDIIVSQVKYVRKFVATRAPYIISLLWLYLFVIL